MGTTALTDGLFSVLKCALLCGGVTVLIGASWSWSLPLVVREKPGWAITIMATARALLIGLLVCSLSAMILGLVGKYSVFWGCIVPAAVMAAGFLAGYWKDRKRLRSEILSCLPGMVALFAILVLVLSTRIHSEWIVGGLDPGVYVNEAVTLGKTGTFYPPDTFFHRGLDAGERKAFTRSGKKRTERFPAVAVNSDKGSFEFEFFRLFPALMAGLYRAGGIGAAVRVNAVLGVFSILMLVALLLRTSSPLHAMVSALFLIMQPIWLYHLHVPVTEMLQLVIVCGIALLLSERRTVSVLVMLFFLFAAGVLNHFSFFPTGGLLVCAVVWIDFHREDRTRVVVEHLVLLAGVATGAVVDFAVAPISFYGWEETTRSIIVAGCAFGILALVADAMAMISAVRGFAVKWAKSCVWAMFLSLVVLLGLFWITSELYPEHADATTFRRLVHYVGLAPVMLALLGGLMMFVMGQGADRVIRGMIVFWAALTVVLLLRINEWTVPLYPWATRRYLMCAIPLISVCAGWLVAVVWRLEKTHIVGRAVCCVAVIAAMSIALLQKGSKAWRHTEYAGVIGMLESVAQQVSDDDIVVVDHPQWGMPLTFLSGKTVLNARHFYRRGMETMAAGMSVLTRLKKDGKRVRFLTSTPVGLEVYPFPPGALTLEWESELMDYEIMVQHRRAHDFKRGERRKVFRLYSF